jgi:hypothetical protein
MAAIAFATRPQTVTLAVIVDEITALAPQYQLLDPALVAAAAARAWSANTVRAFLSDLRLWDAGCRRSGVQTGTPPPILSRRTSARCRGRT